MPNTILSANMSLPVPVVGVDPGPQYASDINSALTILDAHSHAAGSGVLITPAAININSSLTLNNNILTGIQALTLTAQSSNAGIFSIFSKGVDFYLTDGSSNVIRLTQGGSVAGSTGTITGLPSGTASASFAASTFTFQSATNTAAIIDGRDHIFRLSSASSNALTLSPPAALSGGNYQLFLPTIPAQTNVMTLDTGGNMGSIQYITSSFFQSHTIDPGILPVNPNFSGTAVFSSSIPTIMNNASDSTPQHIVRGKISNAGVILSGTGFTVIRFGVGQYQISYTTPFADFPAVVLTSDTPNSTMTLNATQAPGNFVALGTSLAGAAADVQFNFIAIGYN